MTAGERRRVGRRVTQRWNVPRHVQHRLISCRHACLPPSCPHARLPACYRHACLRAVRPQAFCRHVHLLPQYRPAHLFPTHPHTCPLIFHCKAHLLSLACIISCAPLQAMEMQNHCPALPPHLHHHPHRKPLLPRCHCIHMMDGEEGEATDAKEPRARLLLLECERRRGTSCRLEGASSWVSSQWPDALGGYSAAACMQGIAPVGIVPTAVLCVLRPPKSESSHPPVTPGSPNPCKGGANQTSVFHVMSCFLYSCLTSLCKHGFVYLRYRRFSEHTFCGQECNMTWLCTNCRGTEGLGRACDISFCSLQYSA